MRKILIIGSDINAYYMARSYHELYNKKVDVVANEKIRFTQFSNFLNITYDNKLKTDENFASILIVFAKKHYKDEKPLLIPCHDVYVRLVVENRKKLQEYYVFNCPSYEIVDNFLVKEKFYNEYKNMGLDFPNTYFYDVNKKLEIPKNFRYPLIVKPSNGVVYYKHHFEGQHKVYKLNTLKEVKDVVNKIIASGYNEKIIIQECILGDDTTLFDSIFYCNTNGKVELASFAQIGLQEHTPTAIGNCTVLINGYNQFGGTKGMIERMKNFLEKINYHGFAEFDIKYDLRDNKFKIMEINPRQARSSYYLTACGYNLIQYLMDDIYDKKEKPFEIIEKEILLTMVPRKVIKDHIENVKYRDKALKLYDEEKWVDPLTYAKETSLKHKIYLSLRARKYIEKYNEYKW